MKFSIWNPETIWHIWQVYNFFLSNITPPYRSRTTRSILHFISLLTTPLVRRRKPACILAKKFHFRLSRGNHVVGPRGHRSTRVWQHGHSLPPFSAGSAVFILLNFTYSWLLASAAQKIFSSCLRSALIGFSNEDSSATFTQKKYLLR